MLSQSLLVLIEALDFCYCCCSNKLAFCENEKAKILKSWN